MRHANFNNHFSVFLFHHQNCDVAEEVSANHRSAHSDLFWPLWAAPGLKVIEPVENNKQKAPAPHVASSVLLDLLWKLSVEKAEAAS